MIITDFKAVGGYGKIQLCSYEHAAGSSISAIAEATGLTRQVVYRIRDERADAEAALARWAA